MSILKKMAAQAPRRTRSPEYDFHLRHRAYVIQPFMFAPVRPGETLKSVMWQSRAVSDPLANPLMGWHLEYYLFYVQLQDMVAVGSEDTALSPLWTPAKQFVADAGWPSTPTRLETSDVVNATYPDFKMGAYRRIVEEYFREEGEVWNDAWKMSGVLALARRPRKDGFESSTAAGWGAAPDVTINIADGLTVTEITQAIAAYAMLVDTSMGAVTTFEDYLASQGQGHYSDVKRAYRPELLRVTKEWTYPTNTVDPLTGTPTSAVSFSVAGRADKDRYFREPGYIVGLTVARPKFLRAYADDLGNAFQRGSSWLPVQSMHVPDAGFVTGTGNFTNDLFEYGHQFVNFDAQTSGAYKANNIRWTTPLSGTAGVVGCYPVEADINVQLWKAPASNNLRQDGKLALNILTDLPKDTIIGASEVENLAVEEDTTVHPFETIEDLATEFVAKLKERKAGNLKVKLPNIRAALESMRSEA